MSTIIGNCMKMHIRTISCLIVMNYLAWGLPIFGQIPTKRNDADQQDDKNIPTNLDAAQTAWVNKEKYFIVVAANKSAGTGTNLPFAKVDGAKVRNVLLKLGYLELATLMDRRATHGNFVANLKKIRELSNDALVVVYYSGHGVVDPQEKDVWLQLYGQDSIGDGLGLSLSNLISTARGKGYKGDLAVIIDACYSGQGALASALTLKDLKDTTIFTSSSEIQESYSINVDKIEMSAFTHFLLEGLTTDWDLVDENRDGFIQYSDLRLYVRNQLRQLYKQKIINGAMDPYIASQQDLMLVAYNPVKAQIHNTQLAQALAEELRLPNSIKENAPALFLQNNEPIPPLVPSNRARELARQISQNTSLVTQARKAVAEGRFDDARHILDEAIRDKQSDLAEIYQVRGNAEMYAGRYREAIAWFEKALSASSKEDPTLLQEFGSALLYASDISRAEAVLKRELEIRKLSVNYDDKEAAPSTFILAVIYLLQGRLDESKLLLQELQNIKGKVQFEEEEINFNGISSLFLAMINHIEGENTDAEIILKSFLETAEDSSSFGDKVKDWSLIALLDIYWEQGKRSEFDSVWSQLKALWEKAIENEDVNKTSHFVGFTPNSLFSNTRNQQDLERLYTNTLKLLRTSRDTNDSDLIRVLNSLSLLYKSQGKYSDAESFIKEALQISNKAGDWGDTSLLLTQSNLGDLYVDQKKYFEAEEIYKKALEVSERRTGQKSLLTIMALERLGNLYAVQGQFDNAEKYLKRALEISQKVLSPQNLEITDGQQMLAAVYRAQKKYAEAESLYVQKIEIYKAVLGPNHIKVGDSLVELADLRSEQNRDAEAEQLYRQALSIYESDLGNIRPALIDVFNALGWLSEKQGRYVEAEELYQQALKASEKMYGPNDSNVTYPLEGLSDFYERQGEYVKAIPYEERALKIRENSQGLDQSMLAINLNKLGGLYCRLNKYTEAEPLLRRSVEIWEKVITPDVVELSNTLMWLAYALRFQQKLTEAENFLTKSIFISKKEFGVIHPLVAANLNQLAILYGYEGKYEKSEALYKQILEICENSQEISKSDVIAYLENYASLLHRMKRDGDAINLEKRAKNLREKVNTSIHK
jgi:tetratricopeptide (TPR) repeat protein